MLFSLLNIVISNQFKIDQLGFKNFSAGSDDDIIIGDFKIPAAIYFTWDKEITNPTTINYIGEDGKKYKEKADLDNGLRIVTSSGSFKMTNRRNVIAWTLPKESCPGLSIAYNTNHVISDIFEVSDNYSSICMFFAAANDYTTFTAKIVSKDNYSQVKIYYGSSVQQTGKLEPDFEGTKFSGNIKEPFFAEFVNINNGATIEMKYDMKKKLEETRCTSEVLTEYENGAVKFEDLLTKRSEKSCQGSFSLHDLTGMTNLVFGSIIIVVAVIVINESMKAICPRPEAQPAGPEMIPDANDIITLDVSSGEGSDEKKDDAEVIGV